MADQKITYKSAGVNYDVMDPLKKMAQVAGAQTDKNISDTAFSVLPESKGESAQVIDQGSSYLAFVQEGLGTKNLVADTMSQLTQKTYYDAVAQDTVAMIVNDLITVGARPLAILAYWAAGSSDWFTNQNRMEDLVNGWKKACDLSGAVWAGGETPTLSGIIHPATIDLGGSAFGVIDPKSRLTLGENLQAGDAIVLFESSGIHANGLSLARKIADNLQAGYQTRLSNGKMYGEALLEPTIIYAKLIQELFKNGVDIHYMANITGHGWRKLMRHKKELTYRMISLPPIPEVLQFIKEKADMSDEESYGNLNMGAGYAVFVPRNDVQKVLETAEKQGIAAYHAGEVESGPKQVVIEPLKITFAADSLQVRA